MPNAKLETQDLGSASLAGLRSDVRDLHAVGRHTTGPSLASPSLGDRDLHGSLLGGERHVAVDGFDNHDLLGAEFASGERPSLGPVSSIPASISGIFHVAGHDADASGGTVTPALLAANSLNTARLDGALFQQALGDALEDILASESA